MRHLAGLLCVALAAASLSLTSASAAPTATDRRSTLSPGSRLDSAGASRRVPGEVVVRYAPSADRSDRTELRTEVDAGHAESIALPRTEVVDVPPGTVDEAIATLEQSPEVAFAEPNFYYRATAAPDDPRFAQQWGLDNSGQSVSGVVGTADADIDAPEAWQMTTGSHDVVVAVVDTGIAYNHPDLSSNIWTNLGETGGGKESNGVDDDSNGLVDDWRGWDFIDRDNTPRDLYGHGTHVAGIVGAEGNNSYGISGVAWNVQLMPLRVLDAEGSGTTADVASAIAYATEKGADIINLSLGGPDFSLSVLNAISSASNSLVVTAAGNESTNNDLFADYPCNYTPANIVCVAATDSNDNLADYSNYGAVNVDLAAPGSRIMSTVPAFARTMSETFEADISATWIAGGTGTRWTRDLDALGYFVTDSAGANYQSDTDSWLATATPTSLAGSENCTLTYAFKLQIEPYADHFLIEGSRDGVTWDQLGSVSGSTGSDWLNGTHDLSGFDGGDIYLRFRLTSNALINQDGVSVDEVEVRCLATTFSSSEYSYYSGTSMATPMVAGAAALLLSASPDASVASVKSALMSSADALTSLSGKTLSGGRLNVNNALVVLVPDLVPAPLPSVTPSPEPSATTPVPVETAPPEFARAVSLRLRKHLIATGRVTSDSPTCVTNVIVKIKRGTKVVRSTRSGTDGTYRVRLPDRSGRYRARVARSEIDGTICTSASSPLRSYLD